MKTVGKTDIGMRRSRNEDCFNFGKIDDGVDWAVVCDGMGGASGGQTASTLAVDIVSKKIEKCYNKSMNEKSLENLLLSAITTANVSIFDKAEAQQELSGMGTTIVACIVRDNLACIAHVGDSRAYHIASGKIRQITKDHSLVQEMLDNGQITKEQFEHHPNKNIITRALGVGEEIDIDFNYADLSDGDCLILCTDGFSGCVEEEEMLAMYQNIQLEELCEKYIACANNSGGHDNITVVVMKSTD